jgi:hypothetical protein
VGTNANNLTFGYVEKFTNVTDFSNFPQMSCILEILRVPQWGPKEMFSCFPRSQITLIGAYIKKKKSAPILEIVVASA